MAKKTVEKNYKSFLKRHFSKKRIIILLAIVAAIAGWRVIAAKRANKDIKTAEIKRGNVQEELILSGSVNADEYTNLKFSVSGKIAWISVKEGEWVKKGQYLSSLDTTGLNSTYQRALSDLRSAQASVEKAHDDVKNHSADETFTQKETRTTAEVAKDKAYEAVLIAKDNLDNAILKAPFAGLVTFVANPFSGINVLFSENQIEIINPETIYFDVSADQSEVTSLRQGQKVKVVLDSFTDSEYDGIISFIGYTPKAGEAGAVYKIKVIFDANNTQLDKLRIAMTGDAKFVLSEKNDVLYLPPKFVNSDGKGKYLRLGKKNHKVYIQTGVEGEDRIEIIGNIKEGQVVYD